MIKTLTLNPAVDKTVVVDHFGIDQVNRISSIRLDAGGKGLNVSRVLVRLGAPTLALAPLGGSAGHFIKTRLAQEGITLRAVAVPAETRTNLKIVDPASGAHTDLNEPGGALSQAVTTQLDEELLRDLKPGDWLVISGSAPRDFSPHQYTDWVARARRAGVHTVVDADGPLFEAGLQGRPHWVKPNRSELERWTRRALPSRDDVVDAAQQLRQAGADNVLVSLGAEGALLVTNAGTWFAAGFRVDAQSTVGAGDAMVAALVWSASRGDAPPDILAWAVATATAGVLQPGTSAGRTEDIERFHSQVAVEPHTTTILRSTL